LELFTWVAWARLPFTGNHMWVGSKHMIQWIPAAFHNSG
jgi:hypothetical protein